MGGGGGLPGSLAVCISVHMCVLGRRGWGGGARVNNVTIKKEQQEL